MYPLVWVSYPFLRSSIINSSFVRPNIKHTNHVRICSETTKQEQEWICKWTNQSRKETLWKIYVEKDIWRKYKHSKLLKTVERRWNILNVEGKLKKLLGWNTVEQKLKTLPKHFAQTLCPKNAPTSWWALTWLLWLSLLTLFLTYTLTHTLTKHKHTEKVI